MLQKDDELQYIVEREELYTVDDALKINVLCHVSNSNWLPENLNRIIDHCFATGNWPNIGDNVVIRNEVHYSVGDKIEATKVKIKKYEAALADILPDYKVCFDLEGNKLWGADEVLINNYKVLLAAKENLFFLIHQAEDFLYGTRGYLEIETSIELPPLWEDIINNELALLLNQKSLTAEQLLRINYLETINTINDPSKNWSVKHSKNLMKVCVEHGIFKVRKKVEILLRNHMLTGEDLRDKEI